MALSGKRPIFDQPKQWAKDCLKREKASVTVVVRVFQPFDTGDSIEVLFFDGFNRPCTAFLDDATGDVLAYHVGW